MHMRTLSGYVADIMSVYALQEFCGVGNKIRNVHIRFAIMKTIFERMHYMLHLDRKLLQTYLLHTSHFRADPFRSLRGVKVLTP